MKFNLQTTLLLCLLFLSSNKESKSFDDIEQNDNYEDFNKFKEEMNENLEKEEEIIEILDLLEEANDKFKNANTSEKAKEKFEKNAKTLFMNIMVKYVLPFTIPKVLYDNVRFLKEYKESIKLATEGPFDAIKELFRISRTFSIYEEGADFSVHVLDKANVIEKIISKYPHAADLVLSFTNLAFSCYELYYTFQETSKIGLYEKKLELIKKNITDKLASNNYFELKLEDDYDIIKEKIINTKKEIEKIQKEVEDLIIDIESSIRNLEYQQGKSTLISVIGGGSTIFGFFGAIFTGGVAAVPLFISAFGGFASLTASLINLEEAEKGIEKLLKILKEAYKVKEELEKKRDELIMKAKAIIFNKKKK